MNLNKIATDNFVFIESNTTGTGKLFLQKALEKNYQPIFLTKNPDKYPFLNEIGLQPIIVDTNNFSEIDKILRKHNNIKAIFSSSEYYIEMASRLASKYGLPSSDPGSIALCRNKYSLYKILSENGLNYPNTLKINSVDDLQFNMSFIQQYLPVIVKPVQGSGSIGVKLCSSTDTLTHSVIEYFKHYDATSLLIQEYIEGKEYSVETLNQGNRITMVGITAKYLGGLPYFVENGHDFPAQLSASDKELITNLVSASLQLVGFSFGPAHTEVRVKNGIPYIIEINPRLAGGMIPNVIKAACGIDLLDVVLELFAGEDMHVTKQSTESASIRFIIPKKSGVLESILLPNQYKNKLEDFQVYKSNGFRICLTGDFRDRLGHFIVKQKSLVDSQALADKIKEKIEINIK